MDGPKMSPPMEGGSLPPPRRGPRIGLVALILSMGICIALIVTGTMIMAPAVRRAQDVAIERRCRDNLRMLAATLVLYAPPNRRGILPVDLKPENLPRRRNGRPYRLTCPRSGEKYVLNKEIAGVQLSRIQDRDRVVLVSEPNDRRPHGGPLNVLLADGTVKAVSDPSTLIWKPVLR